MEDELHGEVQEAPCGMQRMLSRSSNARKPARYQRARLRRHQIPQGVSCVVAADSLLVHVHLQRAQVEKIANTFF
jgi:hypothetical protein